MRKFTVLSVLSFVFLFQSCYTYKISPDVSENEKYGGVDAVKVENTSVLYKETTLFGKGSEIVSSVLAAGCVGYTLYGEFNLTYLIGAVPLLINSLVDGLNHDVKDRRNERPIKKWVSQYNNYQQTDYKFYRLTNNKYFLLPQNASEQFTASNAEEIDFYISNLKSEGTFNDFIERSISKLDLNGFNHIAKLYPNNEIVINVGKNELCKKTALTVKNYNDVLNFRQKFGSKSVADDIMINTVYKNLSISEILNLIDLYPTSPAATIAGEYAIENAKHFIDIDPFLKFNGRFDCAISNVMELYYNKVSNSKSDKKFKPLLLKVTEPAIKWDEYSKKLGGTFPTSDLIKEIAVDGKYVILGRVANPFNKDTTSKIVVNYNREEKDGMFNRVFNVPTSSPIYVRIKAMAASYFAFELDFERFMRYSHPGLMDGFSSERSLISNIKFSWEYVNENSTLIDYNVEVQKKNINIALGNQQYICSEPYGVDVKSSKKYSLSEVLSLHWEYENRRTDNRNEINNRLESRKARGLPSYDLVNEYYDKIDKRNEYRINCYGPTYMNNTPGSKTLYLENGEWFEDKFGPDSKIWVEKNASFQEAAEEAGRDN